MQTRYDLRACGPVGVRGVPHLRAVPGLRQPRHLRLPQRELPQVLQGHLRLHAVVQVREIDYHSFLEILADAYYHARFFERPFIFSVGASISCKTRNG